MRYDDPDDNIPIWQIAALAFVVVVLATIAAYALSNIVKSVA